MTSPVVAVPHPLVDVSSATRAAVVASTPLLGGESVDIMFVMPKKYKAVSDLPVPLDGRVSVEAIPERWEAVSTWYGGYASQQEFERRVRLLVAALAEEGLEPEGGLPAQDTPSPVAVSAAAPGDASLSAAVQQRDAGLSAAVQQRPAAGIQPALAAKLYSYDPPWTPWFLKRNEVAVVVRPPPAAAEIR